MVAVTLTKENTMGMSLTKSKARLQARIKAHERMVKADSAGSGKGYTKPGSNKK